MLYMFRTVFVELVHHQELKTVYTATVYVKQLLLPAAIENEMELSSISSLFDIYHCHIRCFELWMMDGKTIRSM
jgi:hypothetical protein